MRVKFETTEQYEASHGAKPRGVGHWVFEIVFSNGRGGYQSETFTHFGGGLGYTEAKREVKQWAIANKPFGAVEATIEVQP